MLNIRNLTYIVLLALFACCQTTPELASQYRGILESKGGELAFNLYFDHSSNNLQAYVINGIDTLDFTTARIENDSLFLGFDFYDSNLKAEIQYDGSLAGQWSRRSSGGRYAKLPFRAEPGVSQRYPSSDPGSFNFDGEWNATFTDDDGSYPAVGIFVSQPGGKMHGTFATETGDYRFLEGVYTDSTFTLSTFDGAHAFLFKGRLQEDGSISGDFWSKDNYHATWTAQKSDKDPLRNPLDVSAESAVGKSIEFSFPDLQGNIVTDDDPRFKNRPLLVYLFGSWCPNCADEARLLKTLYEKKYKQTDLQIVGLAYEFTGNFEQDVQMVRRYKERFNIPWTLLVAGSSSKQEAAESLPFLDEVLSFPTSIFINRDHKIRYIHVGFNGPATGTYFLKERKRINQTLHAITNTTP